MLTPKSDNATKKVLLVDDDPDLRGMMRTALTAGGYQVLVASYGRQALNVLNVQIPDMIVMDIDMPEMDGLETLAKIKSNPLTAAIPVIMLTGANQASDVMKSLQAGAELHIAKPFDPSHLLALLKEYLKG